MGVIITRHEDVAEITLDWPEIRNALGPSEGKSLREGLEQVLADADVGAIVLSANGKAFCAGGNLPEILRLADEGAEAVRSTIYAEFQGVFRAITTAAVPVIAAVDGPAVGFGCDLALAGSATCIGTRGWLAQGWAKAGLIPATGGTLYAKRRGGAQAVWRLLAADRLDGPAAERIGLGIACEDARETALAMARTFASLPRAALKALVALQGIDDVEAHLAKALDFQSGFLSDPAFRERVAALLAR